MLHILNPTNFAIYSSFSRKEMTKGNINRKKSENEVPHLSDQTMHLPRH